MEIFGVNFFYNIEKKTIRFLFAELSGGWVKLFIVC